MVGTIRKCGKVPNLGGNVRYVRYSAVESLSKLVAEVGPSFVFNCIVHKSSQELTYRENLIKSFEINSLFPRRLQESLCAKDTFIFNFSTDAVFSGKANSYKEHQLSFPKSIYGMSKFIGEKGSPKGLLLRLTFVATQNGLSRNTTI